jgi:iron-sulfur cluster repair protein YtfE (RIC family)
MKNLLSPQTPVRALLKMRPLAIGVLDKRSIKFWDALDQPLSHVVESAKMDNLIEEISALQAPAHDTDWTAMPLYTLVEHLTRNHKEFQLQDLADMAHVFDIHTLADSDEAEGLRRIQRDFQDYAKALHAHLEEEEAYLFPKILRYEACMRDNRVHPEFHKGSIQSYMAIRMTQEGRGLGLALDSLVDQIREHALRHEASFAGRELLQIVVSLRDRLAMHRALEADSLFPTARELEKNLYNLSIGGDPAVAYHRRGPMDSGILRLEE